MIGRRLLEVAESLKPDPRTSTDADAAAPVDTTDGLDPAPVDLERARRTLPTRPPRRTRGPGRLGRHRPFPRRRPRQEGPPEDPKRGEHRQ